MAHVGVQQQCYALPFRALEARDIAFGGVQEMQHMCKKKWMGSDCFHMLKV